MRTRWLAALGAMTIGLALLAAPDARAGLTDGLPVTTDEVVDLNIEAHPEPGAVVAPAGSGVVFRVTVSAAPVTLGGGAIVDATLPPGFDYLGYFTTAAGVSCPTSITGSTLTCTVASVTAATPATIDLRAATAAASTTPYEFTATVESTDDTEPLEYAADNTATTEVTVQDDIDGDHYAYVCGGCSLTFSDPAVGDAELFVPAGTNGVFVRLEADGSLTELSPCGSDGGDSFDCGVALGIVFDEDEADYQIEDETNPIVVEFTPVQDPCHGVGNSNCAPIGYYDPSKDLPGPLGDPERMPDCDGAGSGDNPGTGVATVGGVYHVCRDQSYKPSGGVRHVILMRSNDPLIPPIDLDA